MKSTQSELVWSGKMHLGDEPGVFADAAYSGLAFELPLTIQSFSGPKMTVSLILKTDLVKLFDGYKGHKVTITQFVPNPSTPNEYDYKEVVLAKAHLTTSADKQLDFEVEGKHLFVSCKIEVDTTVKPGLYDDFLVTQLDFQAENYLYYASLGFR